MIIATKEKYDEALKKLLSVEGVVAIDTETEQFTKEKFLETDLELEGVGYYAGGRCKGYILSSVLDDRFQEVLDTKEVIFHNAKFDLKIFANQGFNIENIKYHDTLIMAWLTNENRRSFALKDLAGSILKVQEDNITRFKDVGDKPKQEDYGMFPEQYLKDLKLWIKTMGEYCIHDCEYTYKLFNKFKPKIEKDDLWYEYESLELPFCTVLRSMESRGIKVDTEYLKQLGAKLDSKLIDLKTDIYKAIGSELDINSPKQLREYFFGKLKYTLPDDYRTPKGELSTNVNALKYLAEEKGDEVSKLILSYRELSKLNSTYVKGMMELTRDNVIRAGFRQTGTKTGRLSSSRPNLQNIPRREDEWNIRKAFVAREGYTFVISDYSQIELRLMAWFSKDPTMVKTYQENGDIHQATADAVGCERVHAKAINFGINYGMGAYGLAGNLGISQDEAQKFIDGYFAKFPNVKLFSERAKNTVRKKYAVHTITKRKRRFKDYIVAKKAKDWKRVAGLERQAVNAIIQGSASDILKIAMRNIHKKLKEYDAHILVQIHDELVIEVPKDKAEEVSKIVKHEMEHAVDLDYVPLITEPQISDCWVK